MSQSLVKNLIHLVYSTKHRNRWIERSHQQSLFAYQAGIFRELDCPSVIVGGVEDHVHALFNLSKTLALSKVVDIVKSKSSKWMKIDGPKNPDFYWQSFYWQSGYGGFSVSESNAISVRSYIENQEQHHRTMTFQDEFRELLRRHGMECDERYVWD